MILENPFISSPRLLLRLGNKQDVPEIINYFDKNKEHLAFWQPLWHSNFLTQEFWQQQVEENLKEFQSDRSLKLFIFKAQSTEIIGHRYSGLKSRSLR